ncbi:hypothetical protein Zmor_007842 [Zophobas morio]|uniref:Odorant receptor n=1 Tax=Zophobas morio TaxID=2755281 RepID=A0AA38IWA9_9CUCU|nr:hypothetical protein Zmor_007842 [Zophobas morio]
MEHHNWISKIKLYIFLLRIMGLWPESNKPGIYTLYSTLTISLYIIGHLFFQVVNVYFIAHDLASVVATSFHLLIEFLAAVKSYYIMKNISILKDRIITFKSDWFQPRSPHQRKLIEPTIYFWQMIFKVCVCMAYGCNAFWAIYPLIEKSEEKRLPFLAWYPYDYNKSPYYEITYIYQVICIGYLTTIHLNVDTLIYAFCVYTSCQFDILADNIRNLANVDDSFTDSVHHNMLKCVEHHKNSLSFIEGSTKFFSWILLWHLLVSGVSIGISLFQLTTVVPLSSEFYSLVSFINAITLQIFMYCWFGEEVQTKSENLSYAVFESDWTDLLKRLKRTCCFLECI